MEQFKVEHFERDTGDSFPQYKALSPIRTAEFRGKIAEVLNLAPEVSGLDLLRAIRELPSESLGAIDDGEEFDLRSALARLGLSDGQPLYLNWDRFEMVDCFELSVLSRHFDDIWYPGVDDIEVFDEQCRWFLSVDHGGVVKLYRCPVRVVRQP